MTAADKNPPTPTTAAAADFQAQLEPLLKRVAQQGQEIIVTQNGCPLARVTPYTPQPGDPPFPAAEPPVSVPSGLNRTRGEQLRDRVGPMPTAWWLDPEVRWENAAIHEDLVKTKDRDGKMGARKRVTIKLLGEAVELSDVEWVAAASNPYRTLSLAAEPPILEDVFEIKDADGNVVERRVYHFQIWGDIVAPIDEEWEAEVNPDRTLNPDAEPAATTTDSDPEEEPPILESFINGKRYTLQVFGDIDGPMPAEWFGEVNPDRPLNPDAEPAATTTDSDPEEEPPILESFINGKRYTLQVFGDIDGPMPAEWFGSPAAAEEDSR